VKQYRLAARKYLWELPAGTVDPGETVFHAARREWRRNRLCAREKCRSWRILSQPRISHREDDDLFATDLKKGEATPMEDERIETQWFKAKRSIR